MMTSTGHHKDCTTVNPWLYQTRTQTSIPTQHNLYNEQLPLQRRCTT